MRFGSSFRKRLAGMGTAGGGWRRLARPGGMTALAAATCLTLSLAAPAGALAATPRTPGSSVPPGQNAAAGHQAERPAGLGKFEPEFDCEKPGTSHLVTVGVNLADVHITSSYDKHHPTELKLGISGTPKFDLNFDFKGDVECSAEALAKVPLGDTGLELKIGPKLTFKADGEVAADFTWQPTLNFGFTLNRHGFTKVERSMTSSAGADFTGKGSASLSLGVDATVETAGGVAGLEGLVGPVFTVKVSADSATRRSCWSGKLAGEADFTAFVKVFHFLDVKAEYDKEFDAKDLGRKCTDIIFDGKPGTGAPPKKLGPYQMRKFPADPTPSGTTESHISGPTGRVKFDSSLTHYLVGNGWATWSNGYTGDVYTDFTVSPEGNLEITVTLPPHTGAFYAYAEPNKFTDFDMSAIVADGPDSGDITVNGQSGAKYFGFYATCGHTISSITYTDSGGDTAMAIGELGIAHSVPCHSARH